MILSTEHTLEMIIDHRTHSRDDIDHRTHSRDDIDHRTHSIDDY